MAKPKHTWRKGLRWDVGKGWVVVKTGRLLTATGLQRKKTSWRKKFDIPKPPKKKPRKPRKKIPYDTQDYIYKRIEKQLKEAEKQLKAEGYTVDSRVRPNKDGTVDGELRVRPDEKDEGIDAVVKIFLAMERLTKAIKAGKTDTWIAGGVRFKPIESEKEYIRFMGMSQANTNYSRNTGTFRANNLVGAREIATNWMAKREAEGEVREPEQVILRLHWNKENKQPTRKGTKKKPK